MPKRSRSCCSAFARKGGNTFVSIGRLRMTAQARLRRLPCIPDEGLAGLTVAEFELLELTELLCIGTPVHASFDIVSYNY